LRPVDEERRRSMNQEIVLSPLHVVLLSEGASFIRVEKEAVLEQGVGDETPGRSVPPCESDGS
jgi:hypothetical protein